VARPSPDVGEDPPPHARTLSLLWASSSPDRARPGRAARATRGLSRRLSAVMLCKFWARTAKRFWNQRPIASSTS